ncbi:hypothetical protein ABT354_08850 [Streptomyces sp. NPDC000594]|uniref:hypothetical protein n=1 Tax=Streptomyces sp. NPDC000594 TaxID=3154261 RepID=UPI0033337651
MPDESTPPTGSDSRTSRGPRHAAPRKSLLAKVQRPAGKAMALAAMPTAVLVGMGLAPKLALAEGKDIPYAPGPCVTRSEEPAEPAGPPSPAASAASAGPSDIPVPGVPPPARSPDGNADDDGSAGNADDADRAGDDDDVGAPEDTDGSERPRVPLGPLDPRDPRGPGRVIGDLLGGTRVPQESAPAAKPPTTSATGPGTEPAEDEQDQRDERDQRDREKQRDEQDRGKERDRRDREPPEDGPDGKPAEKDARDTAREKAKKAIADAAARAGVAVEELDEKARSTDPVPDEDIPEGAKPRFPCPVPDPEALAAAEEETGLPLLPDEPWVLESSLLALTGLKYHGIVEVRTAGGELKKALKFTVARVEIRDLHQLVPGPGGTTLHAQARADSVSTIRRATVTMYTEELKGNLFGLIPITFSPHTPPPVNLPFAFFTDARVVQAGQFGGTLTIPGLRNFTTGDLGGS